MCHLSATQWLYLSYLVARAPTSLTAELEIAVGHWAFSNHFSIKGHKV